MKQFTLISIFLVFVAGNLVAQKLETPSHGHHSHHSDQEVETTTDPFGNVVESFSDPVNPNWVPGKEEAYVLPVTPEEYMRKFQEQLERQKNKAAPNIVRVYLAIDTEYIQKHPDWPIRAMTIFQVSTAAFVRDGEILFMLGGFFPWNSSGDDNSAILADLASDFSHLPDGIVVGFTRDENFTAGGKAYVYSNDPGLGFNVVYDQSISSTIYALRHEISHNYGMSHDTDSSVCMMNYDYAYSVDYWDNAHENQLVANRDRFGPLR